MGLVHSKWIFKTVSGDCEPELIAHAFSTQEAEAKVKASGTL